ncbi:MAG: hypothetical protein Q9220_002515 [cf. Caloplaca sp. 1 TL-2023]
MEQDDILRAIPEIRDLTLSNCMSDTVIPSPGDIPMAHLQHLRLTNYFGEVHPEDLLTLRTLELARCAWSLQRFSTSESITESNAAGLEVFSAWKAYDMTMRDLLRLLGSDFSKLRKLNLGHCLSITAEKMMTLISMGVMDQVVELDLSNTQVTDEVIKSLAARTPRLTRIKISLTKATGIGIKYLLLKPGSKLQYLDISGCGSVSQDAVAFARRVKGLTVACSSMDAKGGKKVQQE